MGSRIFVFEKKKKNCKSGDRLLIEPVGEKSDLGCLYKSQQTRYLTAVYRRTIEFRFFSRSTISWQGDGKNSRTEPGSFETRSIEFVYSICPVGVCETSRYLIKPRTLSYISMRPTGCTFQCRIEVKF